MKGKEVKDSMESSKKTSCTCSICSSVPQSPDTAPQTETSWPPPASSDLLWPCSHTARQQGTMLVTRFTHRFLLVFQEKFSNFKCFSKAFF